MSADDGLTQQQIEDGIRKELLKLQAATADADQTAAFAALAVLLGQHPDAPPQEFVDFIPSLPAFLGSKEMGVQQNAVALLISSSMVESCWQKIVACGIPKVLVEKLAVGRGNAGLHLNLLAALAAVVQGGPPGVAAVEQAGGFAQLVESCSTDQSEQLQEAAVDAVCQVATYEDARPVLAALGAIPKVAALLATQNAEVQVRALVALGMLAGGDNDSSRLEALAAAPGALPSLLSIAKDSEDDDCRRFARDLCGAMHRRDSLKSQLEAALRAMAGQ